MKGGHFSLGGSYNTQLPGNVVKTQTWVQLFGWMHFFPSGSLGHAAQWRGH